MLLTSITIEDCTRLVSYSQRLHFSSGQLPLVNNAKLSPGRTSADSKISVQLIAYRIHPFFTWVTLLCNVTHRYQTVRRWRLETLGVLVKPVISYFFLFFFLADSWLQKKKLVFDKNGMYVVIFRSRVPNIT